MIQVCDNILIFWNKISIGSWSDYNMMCRLFILIQLQISNHRTFITIHDLSARFCISLGTSFDSITVHGKCTFESDIAMNRF